MTKGSINKNSKNLPSYISLENPRYVEIENIFYSGLIIIDYNKENEDIIFKNLINQNINMRIGIFYEKRNRYKTIRELTNNITNLSGELNKEAHDAELVAYTKNDAKYIRSQMQINNEDLYNIYTYVIVFSLDKEVLEYNLNKIEGILNSNGLITKRGNFREDEILKATFPIYSNKNIIKNAARRNILTSGLAITYPFILSNVFDEKGILLRNK